MDAQTVRILKKFIGGSQISSYLVLREIVTLGEVLTPSTLLMTEAETESNLSPMTSDTRSL